MGIKIQDIAYVKFSVPDLDQMEEFLRDFGLVRAERSSSELYMRGTDGDSFIHATQKGDPGLAAIAFEAASVSDLETLAAAEKTSVEKLDAPGGGFAVRLTDPNGFQIEIVANRQAVAKIGLEPHITNDAHHTPRLNRDKKVQREPSHVKRIGHCVLNVRDFRESEQWYKSRFGMITSDEIEIAPGQALGAFLRCDRGEAPSDHHTLFLLGTGKPKFNHAAFEVADFDDLMAGSEWLKEKQRHHEWGVGRHILGSQIFDYWRDPWKHTVEHWTDGDLFDAKWGSRKATIQDLLGVQWGPAAPPTMG